MRTRQFILVVSLLIVVALESIWAASKAPLADAVMRQDHVTAATLLRGGTDVNAAQGDGMTGLHWAARHGHRELAALLLDAGADTEATTRLGDHRPLHVASQSGQAQIVSMLLESGADPMATTTTGTTPLHFSAGAGSVAAIDALVAAAAPIDAREPIWGQTPLMFAAAGARTEAVSALLAHGADPAIVGRVVNISARSDADQIDSRERRARVTAIREGRVPEPAAPRPATPASPASSTRPASREVSGAAFAAEAAALEADLQEEPEPLGFADLVGTHGGLTAVLLAARDGYSDTVQALIAGGADINQVSAADGTSPLLIAAINGHFDLAMKLLQGGADPTLSSDAGATPLYGAINMQWAPKARHPQPTDYMQQSATYLDVASALLDAGADVNTRLTKSLWYTTYNRDLLGVDRTGATPFWRAAYALDMDAMRLLLTYGADPHLPTVKVPGRGRTRDRDPSGLPPVPLGGPAVSPLLAASGVGYGQGYAGNSHRHVPGGWLPAIRFLVEELGADVRFRDHNGYSAVHHAAARGDNELVSYLVSQGVDVTEVSRRGQTTVDMANGPVQRIQPFPETIALLESLGAKNNHRCLSC